MEAAAGRLALGITRCWTSSRWTSPCWPSAPACASAELHGLYTRDGRGLPRIRVWMRTVRHQRVVAFRTFLRTLLHEVGHHLDYTHLRLEDSFHTEGFFKRESSLFYQLVPREDAARLSWPWR